MWQGGPWIKSELTPPAIWFLLQWEHRSNGSVPLNYRYLNTAKVIFLEYFYISRLSLSGKNVVKMSAISMWEQGRWTNKGCIKVLLRWRLYLCTMLRVYIYIYIYMCVCVCVCVCVSVTESGAMAFPNIYSFNSVISTMSQIVRQINGLQF